MFALPPDIDVNDLLNSGRRVVFTLCVYNCRPGLDCSLTSIMEIVWPVTVNKASLTFIMIFQFNKYFAHQFSACVGDAVLCDKDFLKICSK